MSTESHSPHEATPVSPRDSVTLPITAETVVAHVKSHAGRLKRLEDSGEKVVEGVKAMLAKHLIDTFAERAKEMADIKAELNQVKAMTSNQDKFLTRIDGGMWLLTRVIVPGLVLTGSASWALYTYLHK